MRSLVAFVDCSSFYCSCERVFDPGLQGRPVVVLSNNDGCVISLTQEAKDLGIGMGAPYFKHRDEFREKGVAVFSSNYTLYADMSKRVIETLARFGYEVEQYSIDEAFLHIPYEGQSYAEIERLARAMHDAVTRGTGIEVRVSIAETKTLAKVGAAYAKGLIRAGKPPAVCFFEHPEREAYLASMHASGVWGVGRRWAESLAIIGVNTAADLRARSVPEVQRRYGSVLARTALELRGIPSIQYQGEDLVKKTVIRSRMFSHPITDYAMMARSIAMHTARAAEKLRADGLVARSLGVSLSTGRTDPRPKRCRAFRRMPAPTSDTSILMRHAAELLEEAFVRADAAGVAYRYAKSGVFLGDVSSERAGRGLFSSGPAGDAELMRLMDGINRTYGKRSIGLASLGNLKELLAAESGTGRAAEWNMKREFLSPAYTTDWRQLMRVRP